MTTAVHALVTGTVQGVGFRPFVARLARSLGLRGAVRNVGGGVEIELEGDRDALAVFRGRLEARAPTAARIDEVRWTEVRATAAEGFSIETSRVEARPTLSIPADLAACDACLREIDDPNDPRYGYALTTCTQCGPRFTIAEAVPWDRARTSMQGFPMCPRCAAEYGAVDDRRYHAEPIACPVCGPRVRLVDFDDAVVARDAAAIDRAAQALRHGEVVAVLGLGGFQLLVDAKRQAVVARLRTAKERPRKPLAVMFPDLESLRHHAELDGVARAALTDPSGPIVLLPARGTPLCTLVAPGLRRIGAMLPTTPLHHLLLQRFGGPVVATSGNRRDEPIAITNRAASRSLRGIADLLLVHDRPVVRRCDDSVVQVSDGRARVLRAARGVRPLSLPLPCRDRVVIATGGHLKCAPALAADGRIVLWPHIGDLDTVAARQALAGEIEAMEALLGRRGDLIATDAHPDYATTTWARADGRTTQGVFHHHAHIAACLAEHGSSEALGFAWDGTGLGPDGTAWGGECLHVDPAGARRVASLLPFALPGGDAAARNGNAALAGLLETAGLSLGGAPQVDRFRPIARRPRLSPNTTSVGRLFDAVAALTGVAPRSSYEGEAAIMLEQHAVHDLEPYAFDVRDHHVDWRPMLAAIIAERDDVERVASRFHATLVAMAMAVVDAHRPPAVALGGGCFHNANLVGRMAAGIRARGMSALIPRQVPAGDGGLALGQAWVVCQRPTTQ